MLELSSKPTDFQRSSNFKSSYTPYVIRHIDFPFRHELGCSGDWQPDCLASMLTLEESDLVWQSTFTVPAGNWSYKAALNGSWDENYGANATANGSNIGLSLAQATDVKFFYDNATHWMTDNQNSVIASLAGNFQAQLGCSGVKGL